MKVLASIVVVTALMAATWKRASLYADPNALWRDTIAKNPSARAVLFNQNEMATPAGFEPALPP